MLTTADLLDFERAHPRHNGAKEDAIIRELGLTPARYYVLLHRAAVSLEGIRHDPVTARYVRVHQDASGAGLGTGARDMPRDAKGCGHNTHYVQ